jgi:hypothetical protein
MEREFEPRQQINGGKIVETTAIGSAATSLFMEMLPMPLSLPRRKDGGRGGGMPFVTAQSLRRAITSVWAIADHMLKTWLSLKEAGMRQGDWVAR